MYPRTSGSLADTNHEETPMHPRPIAASCAIALAGLAHADPIMNHQLDDRIVVGFGSQESASGSFDFDSFQDMPTNAFEDWSGAAGAGVDAGGGFGQLSSLISNTTILATGSTNASATFNSTQHNYVSALGSSSHTIGFSIDQSITFSLIASIQAQGEGNAWVHIRDGLFPSNNTLYDFTVQNDTMDINQTITLAAGTYAVQFFANSNITLLDNGSASGTSSFDAAWTVVPAPSGLIPLALGGFMLQRRRPTPPQP